VNKDSGNELLQKIKSEQMLETITNEVTATVDNQATLSLNFG
jgi:hypothetical protein